MKFLSSPNEITSEFKWLMLNYKQYHWCIAWADFDFELSNLLVKNKSKIKRIIVGLKFYGTKPEFIKKFNSHPGVRFIDKKNGTFHPKLYLFKNSDADWAVMIGSANFTSSAYSNNSETMLLATSADKSSLTVLESITEFININWKSAEILSYEFIEAYKKNKKAVVEKIPPLPSQGRRKPTFDKSWKDYLSDLKKENYKLRLNFLKWTKDKFKGNKEFHELDEYTRQSIAGFKHATQKDVEIGCFGTTGSGYYMHIVNDKPILITNAIRCIPKKGKVTQQHYNNFIKYFKRIAPNNQLAAATRILCLIRPDYFTSFNGKNKSNMCKELKVSANNVKYDTYWDLIVEPYQNADWSKPKPNLTKTDQEIYNNRVALLDCLYYNWS